MIYAIGIVGDRPRIYVESMSEEAASSQIGPGEILVAVPERVIDGLLTEAGVVPEGSR